MTYQLQQRLARLMICIGMMGLCLSAYMAYGKLAQTDTGVDLQHLPLGDNKNSTEPQVGYIWACHLETGNGGGAGKDGPWIDLTNGTWDRTAKLSVSGDVAWPNYVFTITVEGDQRVITGNGLPNHNTGVYPVQSTDPAYEYDRNPNSIKEQTITLSLPLNPTLAAEPSCASGTVGIMLTGIPLFDGFDAEGRDAVAHELQDNCHGHPEVTGQYHYHDLSSCIEMLDSTDTGHSELVGYALDGFGIYGFRGEDGKVLTNNDLDECHGHTHEITWEGQQVVMYHYHATIEFPYTVGCFRGTAIHFVPGGDPANGGQSPGGGQGGQGGPGNGGQPPPGGQPGQGGPGDGQPPPPNGGQGGPGNGQPPPPGGQPGG